MVMKKLFIGLGMLLGLLLLTYFLGPKPKYPDFDGSPGLTSFNISEIADFIQKNNSDTRIMPGCEAEIIWADSIGQKTPFSIVYLHGFSAAHPEGFPLHENIASQFGCNLFLTRFPDHGILDSNSYRDIVPKDWIDYGKQAVDIGKSIGEKVILMSTSTGSTVSIYLTAFDPSIAGQILMSPNIDLYDPMSNLLNDPWGKKIGEFVLGGEYRHIEGPDSVKKYWTMDYHINGLIALRELLDNTMTNEVFQRITSPVFLGYYYTSEEDKDEIVSIPAMENFIDQIKTPFSQVEFKPFDAGNHVIGSIYWNPNYQVVQNSVADFLQNTMGLSEKILDHEKAVNTF